MQGDEKLELRFLRRHEERHFRHEKEVHESRYPGTVLVFGVGHFEMPSPLPSDYEELLPSLAEPHIRGQIGRLTDGGVGIASDVEVRVTFYPWDTGPASYTWKAAAKCPPGVLEYADTLPTSFEEFACLLRLK